MKDTIDAILAETGYEKNPYFADLKSGAFRRDDFVETQLQFYYAVIFFSRPMAALAAKIPTPELRINILHNVWEEHGEGDAAKVHGATFREFLARLGAGPEEISFRPLWPEVRIFNTVLAGACVLDDYLVSAAMIGMIEHMFSRISCWIGQAVVDQGWVAKDQLIHYNLHAELDIKHSQDFFDVILPRWDSGPSERYEIEQGLRLGAQVFDGLYRGLHRSRKRRLRCDPSVHRMPSSL